MGFNEDAAALLGIAPPAQGGAMGQPGDTFTGDFNADAMAVLAPEQPAQGGASLANEPLLRAAARDFVGFAAQYDGGVATALPMGNIMGTVDFALQTSPDSFLHHVREEAVAYQKAHPKKRGVGDNLLTNLGRGSVDALLALKEFTTGVFDTEQDVERNYRYHQALGTAQSADPAMGESSFEIAVNSAMRMMPPIAATAMTKGKVAATGFWVTQIAPQRYAEFRDAGNTHDEAMKRAIVTAIPEAIIETALGALGSGAASQTLLKGVKGRIVNVLINAIKEYGKELLEEGYQKLTSIGVNELFDALEGKNADQDTMTTLLNAFGSAAQEMKDAAGPLAFLMGGQAALSYGVDKFKGGVPSRAEMAAAMNVEVRDLPAELRTRAGRKKALRDAEVKRRMMAKRAAAAQVQQEAQDVTERGRPGAEGAQEGAVAQGGAAQGAAPVAGEAQGGGGLDALQAEVDAAYPGAPAMIERHVKELGSVDAVVAEYSGDTPADRYALAVAQQTYGEQAPDGSETAPGGPAQAAQVPGLPQAPIAAPEAPTGAVAAPAAPVEGQQPAAPTWQQQSEQLDKALADGQIDEDTHTAAVYLLESVAPNTPVEAVIEIAQQARAASDAERGEFQEEGTHVLGETRTKVEQGHAKALITLYEGHDAGTAAHEWAHAFLQGVEASAEGGNADAAALLALYDKYHAAQGDELSKADDQRRARSERFAREFADAFLRNAPHKKGRLHKISRAIKKLVAQLRDAVVGLYKSETVAARKLIAAGMDPKAARALFGKKATELGAATANREGERQIGTPNAIELEQSGERSALDLLDRYFADRDDAVKQADVDARNLEIAVRKGVGKKFERRTRQAMTLYIDLKHAEGQGRGTPEQIWEAHAAGSETRLTSAHRLLFNLSQHLPQAAKEVADRIIALNYTAGKMAQAGHVIDEPFDVYLARFWRKEKPQPVGARTGFQTTTPHARKRVYGSIIEGWANGEELRITDAISAMRLARQSVANAIYNRRLLEEGLQQGAWTLDATAAQANGWRKVDIWNFSKYRWRGTTIPALAKVKTLAEMREAAEAKGEDVDDVALDELQVARVRKALGLAEGEAMPSILSMSEDRQAAIEASRLSKGKLYGHKRAFESEDGNIHVEQSVYAAPRIATRLENIFGRSALYDIPGVTAITQTQAFLKAQLLLTSLFHFAAFGRSYMFGGSTGLKHLSPVKAYQEGEKAYLAYGPVLKRLVRNGMTLGAQQEWDEEAFSREKGRIGKLIDKSNAASTVREAMLELYEAQTHFLFGKVGTYLKTMGGILEYNKLVKKYQADLESGKMTEDDVAKLAANLLNDDFGGLHLKRMGRNPTAQHIFRLMALAPDWTESNIRTMVKAFTGGRQGEVYRAFWGRVALKGMGATVIANLLLSAFDDDDFWERYRTAWKAGNFRWLDVDITPLVGSDKGSRTYFRLIGHFADPVKFALAPRSPEAAARVVKGKGGIYARALTDFATGEDWKGRRFTTWRELIGVDYAKGRYKTTSRGKHAEGQPKWGKEKFSLTTWGRRAEGERNDTSWASFALYEARQVMPIQLQAMAALAAGELDGLDAITQAAGLPTRTIEGERLKK